MKFTKSLYVFSGLALLAISVFLGRIETFETLDDGGGIYILLGFLATAFLTFPLGIIGVSIGLALAFTGLATLAEALFISIVISFIVGFWQWYVLFPKVFKTR